ncbi:hypothetical protein, partial [Escherichia coli]|uniref:hypothetical protein n=1 Tax=Escherichia coli TaxID=562 RepID=UPI003CFED3CC
GPSETHFQIPRAIAAKFTAALARTAGSGGEEQDVRIAPSEGPPHPAARGDRHGGAPQTHGQARAPYPRSGARAGGKPRQSRPNARPR